MGAINYRMSEYITIAAEVWDPYIWESYDSYNDYITDLYEEAKGVIEDVSYTESTRLTIKDGYYEGFSIDIEGVKSRIDEFEDEDGQVDALSEIDDIEAALLKLVDIGLIACSPGWCTTYTTPEATRQLIKEACEHMRQDVKDTPIYYTPAKRLDNGDIVIMATDLMRLLWSLENIDCSLIGEEYCVSNYDMGVTVYSYYTDLCYNIYYSDLDGESHVLKGHAPSEVEMELIKGV